MGARLTAILMTALLLGTLAGQADEWPRMDVLELLAPTQELVNGLARDGFIVDVEHMPSVRVYATADRRAELDRRRVAYVKVGQQPNPQPGNDKANLGEYHNYAAMTERLQSYALAHPGIMQLVSIGKSIENRELWAVRISDNPGVDEDEPEFKYVSTMHGDEWVGTELCLYLIDLLLTSYSTESVQGARLTQLVDTTDIWIMPLMNPDGREQNARFNKNGVDLNRNFPSYVVDPLGNGNIFDGDPLDTTGREVETQLVMEWTAANSFVLSANIHTGTLVVNYPYDEGDGTPGQYDIAPDDSLFIDVSTRYSIHNSPMYNSSQFDNGITNGSDWYTVYGGMQDWNYRYVSCNEVTLELSAIKRPQASTLATYWEQNRESMLSYMESVHIGVRGLVTDSCTGAPVFAKVLVSGNTQGVYTDPDVGDYHRMLLPGTHAITVSAEGYAPQTLASISVGAGSATRRDVALVPLAGCGIEEGEGDGGGEGDGEGAEPGAHTADQDGDNRIELNEILRIIQLYAAYRFQCQTGSEDGYAPFGGECLGCGAYSSDYNPRDCIISLSELLRAVQIFNAGGYTVCPNSPEGDGVCAGAAG